jgi:hypothetical protein
MQNTFRVIDAFSITGRGVAAVIEGFSSAAFGAVLTVGVRLPSGQLNSYDATKEAIRLDSGREAEAWLLRGASADQVPRGSTLLLPEADG